MAYELYDHQTSAISDLRASFRGGHRAPVLQAPTGFGKTILSSEIVSSARKRGQNVTFTVPHISLIDQTMDRFYKHGISGIGVMQANHPATDMMAPIQIASTQTLARRAFPNSDLVLVDECHEYSEAIKEWVTDERYKHVKFIGMSATPWSSWMGQIYDDLIIAATLKELIDKGFLSKFRVFAPYSPDLSRLTIKAGDYREDEIQDLMGEATVVGDIVANWCAYGENRPTLCYAVNRSHARVISDAFNNAGVPSAYQDAFTSDTEREQIRKNFESGRIKVVCNVGTLTTGVDWDVRCIILARPTKSEKLFVQIIGRGLRTADGKKDCLVFDHTSTTLTLGMPTDIYYDRLMSNARGAKAEREAKQKERPKQRECGGCKAVIATKKCGFCGFEFPAFTEVEVGEGDLKELGKANAEVSLREKQRWWSGLLMIAAKRGRARGWASYTYKDKFKEWPNGLLDSPQNPDADVLGFVKHKDIKFAKRKKKAEATHAA